MPNHIDWYLVELDRQLADFPEERRQAVLVEVESHLREQAEDLEQAGLTQMDADIESVRVFGEPAQFASRLKQGENGRGKLRGESEASLKGTSIGLTGLLGGMGIGLFALSFVDVAGPEAFATAISLAGLIICISSACSRRISLGSILAGLIAGGAFCTLLLSLLFVDYGSLDGTYVYSIWRAVLHPSDAHNLALKIPFWQRIPGFGMLGMAYAAIGTSGMASVWVLRHLLRVMRRIAMLIRTASALHRAQQI